MVTTRVLAMALASAVVLGGCASAEPQAGSTGSQSPSTTAAPAAPADAQELLSRYGVESTDAVDVIDTLDRVPPAKRSEGLMASVKDDELLLTSGERQFGLDIPQDQFYLSMAPYIDETHDCFYHSLTTCLGELRSADVGVQIVEDGTNKVLVEGDYTTFENGFIGFWLPADVQASLRVTHDGKVAETAISTDDEAPTCLTTLKLV
jgi:hypothetical protein